mmetsp:Transcript_27040/g.89792  ORF Transcript_27040/g.89792 Transcript_27040/m.89792 type:complete len:302 (+) Transcript_27040:71-976(+)
MASDSRHSMSAAALLELSDVPESANEPGPGHYFGPESMGFSSMGPQRFAKNRSAPCLSLPRTNWNDWEKVCISKEHSRTIIGRVSPGAAYDIPGQLSQQTTKFGSGERPSLTRVDPHGSPGPVYNVRDAPGQSIGYGICEKEGRVKKGFGLAERFPEKGGPKAVGPGEYARKDSGMNLGSGRSIGAGRAAWEKVKTPGQESEFRCRASPGPGPPLWSNISRDGSAGGRFGSAERFPTAKTDDKSPGPGSYRRSERDVSNPKQHLSDTRNPCVGKFGKQPKKPRFRPALAMMCGTHGGWGYF